MFLVHLNPFQIFPYNKLGVKQCECVHSSLKVQAWFICLQRALFPDRGSLHCLCFSDFMNSTVAPFPNLDDLHSANAYLICFQQCTVRVDLLCLHVKVRR